MLEDFAAFDNRYLLSIDSTGLYSFTKVECPQCGVKKQRNGETEYYHQLLVAVIVHPDQETVLPLDLKPIVTGDGDKMNDCERNAAKRLLLAIHQQYADRPFTVLKCAGCQRSSYANTYWLRHGVHHRRKACGQRSVVRIDARAFRSLSIH